MVVLLVAEPVVESPWMTLVQCAAYVGKTEGAFRAWLYTVEGAKFPVRRLGLRDLRFHKDEVDGYMRRERPIPSDRSHVALRVVSSAGRSSAAGSRSAGQAAVPAAHPTARGGRVSARPVSSVSRSCGDSLTPTGNE